ncbi:unnamed protein product [Calypogeia fissa]
MLITMLGDRTHWRDSRDAKDDLRPVCLLSVGWSDGVGRRSGQTRKREHRKCGGKVGGGNHGLGVDGVERTQSKKTAREKEGKQSGFRGRHGTAFPPMGVGVSRVHWLYRLQRRAQDGRGAEAEKAHAGDGSLPYLIRVPNRPGLTADTTSFHRQDPVEHR